MQPKWRQGSGDSLPNPLSLAKASDNLNALKKGGVSGLVTVLIALKWWAPLDAINDTDWDAAVADLGACFGHMLADTSQGTKRKRATDEENKGVEKKKKVTGK
jgi:hypothetical protein